MKKQSLFSLPTPLYELGSLYNNQIYVKRDDTIPFAFGGNKARMIEYFLQTAMDQNADCLVTYGSFNSNHCRITAAAAARSRMECVLICEDSLRKEALPGNELVIQLLGARRVWCKVQDVAKTIDKTMCRLRNEGKRPFFIRGGGHDLQGVEAFVEAYREMRMQAPQGFDYIFLASGTGTTQAGLLAGSAISGGKEQIVGISVARTRQKGAPEVQKCIESYAENILGNSIEIGEIIFEDSFLCGGYFGCSEELRAVIIDILKRYSFALDPVYTGKAFYGMREYLKKQKIKNKRVLFWHTGGQPIFLTSAEQLVRK